MSEKLLPCPFCGSDGKIYHEDIGDGYSKENIRWNTVICCVCYSESKSDLSEKHAVKNWNTRHYPPEIQAVIEAAKKLERLEILVDNWNEQETILISAVRALEEMDAKHETHG